MSYRDDSSSASRSGGPGGGAGQGGGGNGGGSGGGGGGGGDRGSISGGDTRMGAASSGITGGGFTNNQGAWNGNGKSLGLTTGNTWHGNTAFGPSGGDATGYATRDYKSLSNAGMGPSMGSYSHFKDMNGNDMFGGSPIQGQSFSAMSGNKAYNNANQAYQAWKNNQIESSPLDRPTHPAATITQPPPPVVKPKPFSGWSFFPRPPELSIPFTPRGSLSGGFDRDQGGGPGGSISSSNSTDSFGYPTVLHDTRPAGVYASGGAVRSAMLTAKAIGKKSNAIVLDAKGGVMHAPGPLKSGPIMQMMPGGQMKHGTIKITWES